MDKIYTANDKAIEKGYSTYRELLKSIAKERGWEYVDKASIFPVYAFVDTGRWLAKCTNTGCNGVNYVESSDPDMFYCFTCQNKDVNGWNKVVIFPENREAIEEELLKRDVIPMPGMPPTDAMVNSTPKIPRLVRSWNPDESLERLKKQREIAETLF